MNFGNIPQIKNQITKWIFRKHPADQPRMFNLPTDFQFRFPGIFNPYPAADALKSVPTGHPNYPASLLALLGLLALLALSPLQKICIFR